MRIKKLPKKNLRDWKAIELFFTDNDLTELCEKGKLILIEKIPGIGKVDIAITFTKDA